MRRSLAILALLLSGPAVAQQVWTPAPVPGTGTATVRPSERTGGPASASTDTAGPASSSPFSAQPSGMAGTSANTPSDRETGPTTNRTPSLSR